MTWNCLSISLFYSCCKHKFFWKSNGTISGLQHEQNTGINKLLYYGLNNKIIVHFHKYQSLMQGMSIAYAKNLGPILLNSDDEIE